MTKMDKQQRRAIVKGLREQERAAELARMPLSQDQLESLLDHLDANLAGCSDTLQLTEAFLRGNGSDPELVVPWLAEHGGYCDCEVLANLDDRLPQPSPQRPPDIKRPAAPAPSENPAGWDLSSLPPPWRLSPRGDAVRLQLGKKPICTATFIASRLPDGDPTSDDYWVEMWQGRTDLPDEAPFVVDRNAVDVPAPLSSVSVWTSRWTPVLCWIFPAEGDWHLEVRTEIARRTGDFKDVARLVRQLATGTT